MVNNMAHVFSPEWMLIPVEQDYTLCSYEHKNDSCVLCILRYKERLHREISTARFLGKSP